MLAHLSACDSLSNCTNRPREVFQHDRDSLFDTVLQRSLSCKQKCARIREDEWISQCTSGEHDSIDTSLFKHALCSFWREQVSRTEYNHGGRCCYDELLQITQCLPVG